MVNINSRKLKKIAGFLGSAVLPKLPINTLSKKKRQKITCKHIFMERYTNILFDDANRQTLQK